MGEVINIGEGKFERIRQERCPHKHLLYDPEEGIVHCKDCKRPLNPFQAFMIAVRYWRDAEPELARKREELRELETRCQKGLLKATKTVDHAWRSKKMVPVCPHCSEAIFPEDGFGSSLTNKETELQRRKFIHK
ncbi:MAG: hypothetical protein ACLQF0_06810 [Dissulfurispiraceae bacterium]